jgi:hypothetical protein
MSDHSSPTTVSTPNGSINPENYQTAAQFKSAVYDAGGIGSWITDMKLQILWLTAREKPIPEELAQLIEASN